jgi:hypothetical protein
VRAYDAASRLAMKSVLGIGCRTLRRGTAAFPAYGAMETRPIIHASASKVRAVRSYSALILGGSFQFVATIRPSREGSMWQITYGRLDRFMAGTLPARVLDPGRRSGDNHPACGYFWQS